MTTAPDRQPTPAPPSREMIESAGQILAASLPCHTGSPLSALEQGRIVIKDAFREQRLVSYDVATCRDHGDCAGVIAGTAVYPAFIHLLHVNDASPHDADGRITSLEYIEAALDFAQRVLTEGK